MQRHARAGRLRVVEHDTSAVLIDDLFHYREPQARSFRFRRYVRLERMIQHVRRKTWPGTFA